MQATIALVMARNFRWRALFPSLTAALMLAGCSSPGGLSGASSSQSVTITAPSTVASTPQPGASAVSSQPAAASASASDLIAVAKLIYPYVAQYGYYSVCGVNGDLSQCPVTDRLKAFLTQKQTTLCSCQNPAPSMDATATPTGPGGVAHVVLGYQTPMRFDLVIVRDAGRLLVDDQLCTGAGASSSIYARTGGC